MEPKSILLIDDSPDMLILQKAILQSVGYHIFTANSGKTALAALAKIAKPDLILLDMHLEDMSGTEFLIQLEQAQPDLIEQVPVVLLSGDDTPPVSKAVGFIKKFPDIEDFLVLVKKFIRH